MPRENLIQIRRGSRQEWVVANPILDSGELGFETDTGRIKIGDGANYWGSLDYIGTKENLIKVYNNSGSAIQKGQSVYINGFDSYINLPTVTLYVSNGTISEQKFAGLMSEYVADGEYGFVTNFGPIYSINTNGSVSNIAVGDESWSSGDILYAHPTDYGKLTKYKPANNVILIGIITNSSNSIGSILVRSFINPRLSQLNEIYFNNLVNSDLMKYDSQNSRWSNYNDLDGGII